MYSAIISALVINSDRFVPEAKSGFYKYLWKETLIELIRQASIILIIMWRAHGRPKTGDILMQMKKTKIISKNAIKADQIEENTTRF